MNNAERCRQYRARKAGGEVGIQSVARCNWLPCGKHILVTADVCSPECAANVLADFDAWRANGGPRNVFGRYHAR
jgi:hypothetical protein